MDILVDCSIALPVLVDVAPVCRDLLLFSCPVAGIVPYILPIGVDILAVPDVCGPVRKISRLVVPYRCPVPKNILENIQVVPPVLVYVLVICTDILSEVPVIMPQPKDALQ